MHLCNLAAVAPTSRATLHPCICAPITRVSVLSSAITRGAIYARALTPTCHDAMPMRNMGVPSGTGPEMQKSIEEAQETEEHGRHRRVLLGVGGRSGSLYNNKEKGILNKKNEY